MQVFPTTTKTCSLTVRSARNLLGRGREQDKGKEEEVDRAAAAKVVPRKWTSIRTACPPARLPACLAVLGNIPFICCRPC